MNQSPENAKNTILAAVILHNFLRDHPQYRGEISQVPENFFDYEDVFPEEIPQSNRAKVPATVRSTLTAYFSAEGQTVFQDDYALDH